MNPPLLRGPALFGGIAVALLFVLTSHKAAARDYSVPMPAPALTQKSADTWINSTPLSWETLEGKVVMLHVWTSDCWNCYRSFPWLKSIEARFGPQGFAVVGIHTPEFEHEKNRGRLIRKAKEFGITHPIMMDNDYAYWNALANRFWPTFYLIDKQGRIRAHYVGETHAADRRAQAIESRVAELLAE